MSSLNEHFFAKYFAYRRRYVDAILERAPARAGLARTSEIARLGFMLCGNALCAFIFWALTLGAAGRSVTWVAPFALLAAVPTVFAGLTVRGLGTALGDRARVRAGVAAAANAARR